MSDVYSDAILRDAAVQVRRSMLDALPHPKDCPCDMSPGQERKMAVLVQKDRRSSALRKAGRAAAAVLLAFLLGAGAWLTVNTEARAAFFQWAKEVYERHITYRFFGDAVPGEMPAFRLSGLPEGYVETVVQDDDTACCILYENENGSDGMILFYCKMMEGRLNSMMVDGWEHEVVYLNSGPADLYISPDPTSTNELVWIDEERGLFFNLSSFHEPAEMIEMANNMEKIKK